MTAVPATVQEAYGDLPHGWRLDKLKFFASLNNSNVDKTISDDEDTVRLCNYTDVYYNDRITSDLDFRVGSATRAEILQFQLRRGQVLLTKDSEGWDDIGIPALVMEDMADVLCGYHLSILTPGPHLLGGFLAWLCRSDPLNNQFKVGANGVTRYGLGQYPLKNAFIAVPPPETQRRIADYLDDKTAQIDALIEKKRALLDRLAEKRQAIITQAVTKGLNPAAPMKDSGIDWLGSIPAHWEIWPLKRYLTEALYGVSASLEPTGEVGILRMGNLQDGELDFSDLRFLDQVDNAIILKNSDVVFNRTNSLDLVGKAAIYRGDYNGALSLASYLVLFRFDRRYDPEFANYVMGTNVLMALGRTLALPSIGQANLNPNRYAANSFPVPPVAEQREIVAYISRKLEQLKNIEARVRASQATLDEYRSALITAAVTGQIEGLR